MIKVLKGVKVGYGFRGLDTYIKYKYSNGVILKVIHIFELYSNDF